MAIVVRKNGKLNAAFRGIERGINSGAQLGLLMRRQKQGEKRDEHVAGIEDAREQRDAQAHAARMEQMKTLALKVKTDIDNEAMAQHQGTVANMELAQLDPFIAESKQAKEIYQRMSKLDPASGKLFAQEASQRLRAKAIDQDRDFLADEIGMRISQGDFHLRQPDGSKLESPAIMKKLAEVQQYLAHDGDPIKAREMLSGVTSQLIDDETAFESRVKKVNFYRGEMERVAQSGVESGAMMRLVNSYERGAISQREMEENWMDASQGLVKVSNGKETFRVPYDQRENFEALLVEQQAKESELQDLRAQLLKQQIGTEGAQAERFKAEAGTERERGAYLKAQAESEGKAKPKADMTYADARKMAASEMEGASVEATPAAIDARAREIMNSAQNVSTPPDPLQSLDAATRAKLEQELRGVPPGPERRAIIDRYFGGK